MLSYFKWVKWERLLEVLLSKCRYEIDCSIFLIPNFQTFPNQLRGRRKGFISELIGQQNILSDILFQSKRMKKKNSSKEKKNKFLRIKFLNNFSVCAVFVSKETGLWNLNSIFFLKTSQKMWLEAFFQWPPKKKNRNSNIETTIRFLLQNTFRSSNEQKT